MFLIQLLDVERIWIGTSAQAATAAPTNRATVTTTMSAPKIIFVEKTIVGITEARPLQILIAAFQVNFHVK